MSNETPPPQQNINVQQSADGESVGKGCLKVSGGISVVIIGIAIAFMIGIFALCGGCSWIAGDMGERIKEKQAEIEQENEAKRLIVALEAEIETETDPAKLELLKTRLEELRAEAAEPEKILFDPKASIEEQIEDKLTPEEQVYREKLAVLMDAAIAAEDAYNEAAKVITDPVEVERLRLLYLKKTQEMADFQLGKTDD